MTRFLPTEPVACSPDAEAAILQAADGSPLLMRALLRRGITSAAEARAFLAPKSQPLPDVMLLPDADRALLRIRRAVENKEPICVYGDYDADGVSATAILIRRLRSLGANATYYIPSRHGEGYGMHESSVREIAARGARLLITVDNGITAVSEVALAQSLGMDVIVTDHHRPGESLPDCPVVAPSRMDSRYPNPHLCGAGVAYRLAAALGEEDPGLRALAAVATVADVVPLLGENRTLVASGLDDVLQVPGLFALLEAAGAERRPLSAWNLAFLLAPRLNAAGRMGDAARAVELLLARDSAAANPLAEALDRDNALRKDVEAALAAEAERQILKRGLLQHRFLVISGEGWHPGVIGIVASRLVERYSRPAIVFSESDGILTGSGRSVPGVDLIGTLSRFSSYFLRFGGHAAAAGITMEAGALEAFSEALRRYAADAFPEEAFTPCAVFEERLSVSDVTVGTVRTLSRLAPFGEGNPEPVFLFPNASLSNARAIGRNGAHLTALVSTEGLPLRAVAFQMGAFAPLLDGEGIWDVLAAPTINVFRGDASAELNVRAVQRTMTAEKKIVDAFVYDFLYNKLYSLANDWFVDPASAALTSATAERTRLRQRYSVLRRMTSGGATPVLELLPLLTPEDSMALLVFLELGFFTFDPAAGTVAAVRQPPQNDLDRSRLYRLIRTTKTVD